MLKTVCNPNMCAGCYACVDACRLNAISVDEGVNAYNAVIDENKCINCDACKRVCPNNTLARFDKNICIWQGWTSNESVRKYSSSGGIATALAMHMIEENGSVWACTFEKGEFLFQRADTIDEIPKFSGSKYVKSRPAGVYEKIKNELSNGKKVLFVGLPCQVAAVLNYVGQELWENLVTVDLICHGTPSPKVLDRFLSHYNLSLSEIEDIRFRNKWNFQLFIRSNSENYDTIETRGVIDKYMIGFLAGMIYTENCYNCQYAREERVSDVTIGDSWGSELEREEQQKGISLLLVQSEKGMKFVKEADIILKPVNKEMALNCNKQLRSPSETPTTRAVFMDELMNGTSFNKLIKRCYPKQCLKQQVKKILIKAHLWDAIKTFKG